MTNALTTIPDVCMQYTQVFTSIRLESGLLIMFGFIIGLIVARLHK